MSVDSKSGVEGGESGDRESNDSRCTRRKRGKEKSDDMSPKKSPVPKKKAVYPPSDTPATPKSIATEPTTVSEAVKAVNLENSNSRVGSSSARMAARLSTGRAMVAELQQLRKPLFCTPGNQQGDSDVEVAEVIASKETVKTVEVLDKTLKKVKMVAASPNITQAQAVQLYEATCAIGDLFRNVLLEMEFLRGNRSNLAPEVQPCALAEDSDFPTLAASSVRRTKMQAKRSVKANAPEKPKTPSPVTYAIAVSGANMTAEEVKAKVTRQVSITMPNIRMPTVRRSKDSIVLQTSSRSDMELIKASKAFEQHGLQLSSPPRHPAKILITRVPTNVEDAELLEQLKKDGNRDPEVTAEQHGAEIRLKSRGKDRDGFSNVVLEVSERVKEMWKVTGVDLFWNVHRIREMSGVELCFRCYGFHTKAKCDVAADTKICKRCGQEGHFQADCKNVESCRNCFTAKRSHAHGIASTDCFFFKRALERLQLLKNVQE